jgi:hypothetical protein
MKRKNESFDSRSTTRQASLRNAGWPIVIAAGIGLVGVAGQSAQAAVYWDGTGTGWDSTGSWSTASGTTTPDPSAVPGIADDVTFDITGVSNQTVNLNAAQSAKSLTFAGTAGTTTLQGGGTANQTLTLANGITVNSGAGATTIGSSTANQNVAVALSGSQTWANNASTLLTINNGISSSSTGTKILTVQGTGDTTVNGAITAGSGGMNLNKSGTGTLSLSGGGALAAGSISNGGGSLSAMLLGGKTTISSGTYTSGGEFVVGGVTANGGAGVNTNFTMDGGSLTINSYLSLGRGNGIGAVSSDIILNNAAAITANNFSGGFNGGNAANLPKGTFTLNGSSGFTVSGNGVFNLAESAGSNVAMTLNNSSTLTVTGSGNKFIGNGGNGTLTLNGTSSADFGTGLIAVGQQNGNGTLNVNTGATFNSGTEIRVAYSGNNGSFSGSGTITVGGGTLNTNALTVGRGNNDVASTLNGTVNVSSGTLNVRNATSLIGWRGIGTTGTLNVSGGTFNQGTTATTNMSIGSFTGANGSVIVSNGALNFQNNSTLRFADVAGSDASTRTLTIGGGNVTFYSDAGNTVGGTGVIDLMNTANANGVNTINLDGGALTANQIKASSATGTRLINFNGGMLKSGGSTLASTFLVGGVATTANVRAGGAIIDTNGNAVTIGQALSHTSLAADSALTTDGGLTKLGSNTLTLSNASNTYKGVTSIQSGTLALAASSANNIASSSKILVGDTLAHNTAGLNVSGLTGSSITLGSNQTLAGYGSVTGGVTGVSSSTIAAGDVGTNGKLTVNGSFALGAASLAIDLNPASHAAGATLTAGADYDQLAVTGSNSLTGGALALTLGNNLVSNDVFTILDNQGSGTAAANGVFSSATVNGNAISGSLANGGTFFANVGGTNYSFLINYGAGTSNDVTLTVAVPEPGTCAAVIGLGGIGLLTRRRRKA